MVLLLAISIRDYLVHSIRLLRHNHGPQRSLECCPTGGCYLLDCVWGWHFGVVTIMAL